MTPQFVSGYSTGEALFHHAASLIQKVMCEKTDRHRPFLVALDGRCASGKTTLAAHLATHFACPVVHMDDFFLRPEQRTPERLSVPGENIDHERFLKEVLLPLYQGKTGSYAPFSCATRSLGDKIVLPPSGAYLIEGSYALHPFLRPYYDLKLFLTVEEDEQMRRILVRNGREKAQQFKDHWIPLEETYFDACHVREACDHILESK